MSDRRNAVQRFLSALVRNCSAAPMSVPWSSGSNSMSSRMIRSRWLRPLVGGTEKARTADVDEQHHGQFTFFLEDLDIGLTEACSDVPVHVSDVVTVLVLTHFAERHTASFERGMVFSGEDLVRQRLGLDLDFPDFLQ